MQLPTNLKQPSWRTQLSSAGANKKCNSRQFLSLTSEFLGALIVIENHENIDDKCSMWNIAFITTFFGMLLFATCVLSNYVHVARPDKRCHVFLRISSRNNSKWRLPAFYISFALPSLYTWWYLSGVASFFCSHPLPLTNKGSCLSSNVAEMIPTLRSAFLW